MDDRPIIEISNIKNLERKYVRIGADIPTELRNRLHASIPPGLLSEIIRNLLIKFIDIQKEIGVSEPLRAILDNRIKLSIIPKESNTKMDIEELNTEESNTEERNLNQENMK